MNSVIRVAIRAAVWTFMMETVAHFGFNTAPTVTSSAVISGAFLVVSVLESILGMEW